MPSENLGPRLPPVSFLLFPFFFFLSLNEILLGHLPAPLFLHLALLVFQEYLETNQLDPLARTSVLDVQSALSTRVAIK